MTARFAVLWAGASLLLLLVLVVAQPASADVKSASDLTIGGWASSTFSVAKGTNSSFSTPFMYLTGMANTGKDTKAVVVLSGANLTGGKNQFGMLEAFGEKDQGMDTYRLGLAQSPFGVEASMPNCDYLTQEPSMVSWDLVMQKYDFDNGLYWNRMDKGNSYAVCVTNGQQMTKDFLPGNNSDNNTPKNYTARVGKTAGDNMFGASMMYGDKLSYERSEAPTDNVFRVYGVDYRYMKKDIGVTAEALKSVGDCGESDGFYVLVSQKGAKDTLTKYARFEMYDPSLGDSTGNKTGYTLGVSKAINALTTDSLEVMNVQTKNAETTPATDPDESTPQGWTAAFKVQAKF